MFKVLNEVLGAYDGSPMVVWALRFFLRNPYESLLITNEKGRIEFMDKGSENLLGLPQGGAKGTMAKELFPDSVVPKVLETGAPIIGRIFDVKDGILRITSTYPLIKDGRLIGVVGRLLFRSLEAIDRLNKQMSSLKRELKVMKAREVDQHRSFYTFQDIKGESQVIREIKDMAKKLAVISTDVLISGESGTGKELFAHAIHSFANPERPFIRVNCPAIPFELAESEFFGYSKGAFSGANLAGKPGKFELADNGTILLDEISSLPLSIQGKLLRVLQEREVERLGSTKIQKLKFRLIAASNIDLKKMVREGKFREDLYYRIARATIQLPPLREHKQDIPIYISSLLKTINQQFHKNFKSVSHEALSLLMDYEWPGNMRELRNVLEQASLKKWDGTQICVNCLPPELASSCCSPSLELVRSFSKEKAEKEKELIINALHETKGNKRKAASLLRMPRSTFYKKIREHHISWS